MSFKIRFGRAMAAADKIVALREAGVSVADNIYIGHNVEITGNRLTLGQDTVIEDGAKIVFDDALILDQVRICNKSDVRASSLTLEKGTTIGHDTRILVANRLNVGRNTYIGHSSEIVCRVAEIGEGLYCEHDVTIGGGGGATGPYSEINIGRFVHIGEFSVLNTARPVAIGDEAGLGAHVMLYTHGMWPPALEGYPLSFGPITIGAKAWITGRCIVLPGVSVGEGAVVAMGSVVTRNLPPRCLAGGSPAKVLRENLYNRQLSEQEKDTIIRDVLARYVPELDFKGYKVQSLPVSCGVLLRVGSAFIWYAASVDPSTWPDKILSRVARRIVLTWVELGEEIRGDEQTTVFNLSEMTISGSVDNLSEDLRDFLRRNCVRFYTADKFRSVSPPTFHRLAKE